MSKIVLGNEQVIPIKSLPPPYSEMNNNDILFSVSCALKIIVLYYAIHPKLSHDVHFKISKIFYSRDS